LPHQTGAKVNCCLREAALLKSIRSRDGQSIGGMTYVTFAAQLDSAFPYHPIGAALHLLIDVFGKETRNPCPRRILMFINRSSRRLTYVLLLGTISSLFAGVSEAQDIRIRVVDGRSGKFISNEVVQVWIGDERDAQQIPVGEQGSAMIRVKEKEATLRIESNHYFDCRPFRGNAPRPRYKVSEVVHSGIATENSCAGIHLEPKPGELVFLVRPLRWWERLRR
jgi:hypothetical protein